MSKRKPTTELNDRNWDVEEEPEEAGTFSTAGKDVLKTRVIRKAKRTIQSENRNSGSVFAGFALKTADSSVPKPSLSTGVTHNFGSNLTLTKNTNGTKQESSSKESGDSPDYLRQLKVLNENILSWIQKHVKENPYCILTPSFKDYERHLGDLEKKYLFPSGANSPKEKEKATSPQGFQFEKKESSSVFGSGNKPVATGFTFGQSTNSSEKSAAGVMTGATGFKFGTGLTQSTGGFGASNLMQGAGGFGAAAGSKPFSFGTAAKPATDSKAAEPAQASNAATGEEEDEYQPPKADVREIKEDGAVYTKRCKLFYQKDGQWTERGVGNLHLKPTDDGRTQLIVRADTNLGNILLNILLSSSIPTKRQGKNNVFFMCVPNPPLDQKNPSSDPTPMLIRVKTGEDADELLARLEEMKA